MRTLLFAAFLLAFAVGGTASADPGLPPPASTEVQALGGVSVRTETSTVIQNGVQVRVVRVFNNDMLVREVVTPLGAVAGFESAPRSSIIVIEERTEPATVTAPAPATRAAAEAPRSVPAQRSASAPWTISQLPSTSTAP